MIADVHVVVLAHLVVRMRFVFVEECQYAQVMREFGLVADCTRVIVDQVDQVDQVVVEVVLVVGQVVEQVH